MPRARAAKPVQSNARPGLRSARGMNNTRPATRQNAERQVDEEHPAPVVHVGQVAAERGAQDRTDHHADAPDRHRGAALLGRVDVQHHRLRQRHQRRAEHALQQAEQRPSAVSVCAMPHSIEATVKPTRQRTEQVLAAEARREPADRRRHDRGRDDVGGQHPGDLVERRRQAALHVRQRDVGDGAVQRLHQRRDHRADGDQRAVRDFFTGSASGVHGIRSAAWRSWPVSISASTLMPARRSGSPGLRSTWMRTGSRCTTFTQLPEEF